MTTCKWSFNFYLGLGNIGSPSFELILVSGLGLVVDKISSAVQEYKLTLVIANNNSFNKKLVFIKNQFKN